MASTLRVTRRLLLAGSLLSFIAPAAVSAIVYVNVGAGPVHDGRTWATAFESVLEGIEWSEPGDEIWVAKGTYYERVEVV